MESRKESLMNTQIRTSYDFSLALQERTQAFTKLWHAKLEAEAQVAALIAQDRLDEADVAWDRVIDICHQIRAHRASI
jgi:hypothetical protein